MNGMERRTEVYPSWDKRSSDPKKNYGSHCCDIAFYLIGKRGAYQFKAFTGWFLPHLKAEGKHLTSLSDYPMGYDVGYHAREPQYEGQSHMDGDCPIIGGKCYYDGSGLYGAEVGKILVSEGSEAVWKILEERYVERFGALE